jgi:cobalt-zinc-cadmium efflux system outer membrane protein
MKKPWVLLLLVLAGHGPAGCQTYHPQPLTAEGVDEALRAPETSALSVRASTLHHPLLPSVTIDMRDGLDPDEAAVVAVLVHPMLRAVRDERGLADAQLLQAGLLPNPQLSATVEPVTGGATAGTFTGYGYGATWDLSALIARRAKVDSARANRSGVELDVAWQEWQVAQAARLAVYSLIGLQEQADLSRQMRDRLADNLALVGKAEQAGLMTGLDLSAAETASNQAQADWIGLQDQVRQQSLALNRALGLPPGTPISLQQGTVLPSRLDLPPEQDVLSGLEERRLDLVALRKGYESQEAAVRVAVLEQFPKINIGVSQARDTSDVITLPFAVSVDLPVFDRNQATIARERATRQLLYDEYIRRVFEARSEIAKLLANAVGIEAQLCVAEAAVPSLERLVDTYRKALDQGQADVLVYYTAWNDLTTKRSKIVTLKQQLAETRIALEIAAGVYELRSLGHTPAAVQPGQDEVKP